MSLDPRGSDADRKQGVDQRFDPRLLVGRHLTLVEREEQPLAERQRPVGVARGEPFRGQHRDLLGGEARRTWQALARGEQRGADEQNQAAERSEEHTTELQSLMRISYAVFCLKKTNTQEYTPQNTQTY